MPLDSTTAPALASARAAFRTAALAFVTQPAVGSAPDIAAAVPELSAALDSAAMAATGAPGDHVPPYFDNAADGALYIALKLYVDRMIAAGAHPGPPLPFR